MQIGTSNPDSLLAGNFPRKTEAYTFPAGTKLERGTVITSALAAMETKGTPLGVLAETVPNDFGSLYCAVYLTGEFAKNHLILAANAALDSADIAALRELSIFVRDTIPAI